jgi:(p)ppGpp synthase/HD superfamily hydrolase
MKNNEPSLSETYLKAFEYAFILHRNQVRKGSQRPYISHLLAVSSMVMEHGGTETEAIAALLHDAVEDQGGLATLKIIRNEFGKEVAAIVEACSDSVTSPKPPWRERKERYIKKLGTVSPSVILVSQADKLHNLRSLYADYLQKGDALWQYFRGGKDGTLWYYHKLVQVFQTYGETPLLEEMKRVLGELVQLVRSQEEQP